MATTLQLSFFTPRKKPTSERPTRARNARRDVKRRDAGRDPGDRPASRTPPPPARRTEPPRRRSPWPRRRPKVRTFPQTPGVYLMKDAAGRVIYVGKAKNLRARAGSYFLKAAAEDRRTAELVSEIRDIDYLEAESEVDALLGRSPADQGRAAEVQPRSQRRQDLSLPGDLHPRGFSPRRVHPRAAASGARSSTGRSPAPAACAGRSQVLQKIFKFRTCTLDIDEEDEKWRWFRPCLLASIGQCTAPCNLRISKEEYRHDIHRLQHVPGRARSTRCWRRCRPR